jgi:hypothetical protein
MGKVGHRIPNGGKARAKLSRNYLQYSRNKKREE